MITTIRCPIEILNSRRPQSLAIINNQTTLTYRQLHEQIIKKQMDYHEAGIRRGTKIALQSKNSLDDIICLFALWRIGVVVCLLSPRTPQAQIKKQIIELKTLPPLLLKRGLGEFKNNKAQMIFQLNSPATIMLTSGSCGEPKAVVHTIGNHYFSALGSNQNIPLAKTDRWLLSLPLYHVSGLSIIWRCTLAGSTIVMPDPTENIIESIKKFKVTHVSMVPTQLILALNNPAHIKTLQKLKAILLGGAPVAQELIQTTRRLKLPVFLTYGLTEMASQVSTSQKSTGKKIQTLKYRKLKIADDGEILVAGATLFKGYFKNKKIVRPADADGWFHTGDLGRIDRTQGLQVLGRKDNMFISGGENIYPEEIEKALLGSGVVEQAVVVPVKNALFGHRPVAFVKLTSSSCHCKLTKRAKQSLFKNHLTKTLPAFKIPDSFYDFPDGYLQKGIKPNRKIFLSKLNFPPPRGEGSGGGNLKR